MQLSLTAAASGVRRGEINAGGCGEINENSQQFLPRFMSEIFGILTP